MNRRVVKEAGRDGGRWELRGYSGAGREEEEGEGRSEIQQNREKDDVAAVKAESHAMFKKTCEPMMAGQGSGVVKGSRKQTRWGNERQARTYHCGIDRHNTTSTDRISGTVCICRRMAGMDTSNIPSRNHGLGVAAWDYAPGITSRNDTTWISAAVLGVPIRICDCSAHVAASGGMVVVARRVVRAAEAIPAASRHTKAGVVILCVVALAIADLNSGLVAVIVVVEAHVAGRGIGLDGDWRRGKETAEKADNERSKRWPMTRMRR